MKDLYDIFTSDNYQEGEEQANTGFSYFSIVPEMPNIKFDEKAKKAVSSYIDYMKNHRKRNKQ